MAAVTGEVGDGDWYVDTYKVLKHVEVSFYDNDMGTVTFRFTEDELTEFQAALNDARLRLAYGV